MEEEEEFVNVTYDMLRNEIQDGTAKLIRFEYNMWGDNPYIEASWAFSCGLTLAIIYDYKNGLMGALTEGRLLYSELGLDLREGFDWIYAIDYRHIDFEDYFDDPDDCDWEETLYVEDLVWYAKEKFEKFLKFVKCDHDIAFNDMPKPTEEEFAELDQMKIDANANWEELTKKK